MLLRQAKESNNLEDSGGVRRLGLPLDKLICQQEKNKKKKEDKKRDVEERGWIVMDAGDHTIRLANGADSQILANEVSLLFKVIETLKSKTAALESSRKVISEMTSQGFK